MFELAVDLLRAQWAQAWDRRAWATGVSFSEKVRAISLPHAGAGLAAVTSLGLAVFLLLAGEPKPAPPPLPSQVALRSVEQAGRAFKAELSPALAAANRTVPTDQEPRQ